MMKRIIKHVFMKNSNKSTYFFIFLTRINILGSSH